MLIRVLYDDGSFGMVDGIELDRLIFNGGVTAFRRSQGWVRVGHDPVRQGRHDRRRRDVIINTYV
ncbi:GSU3473 family protein [Geobacter sp. DSM 9736]|uniref:GSU3473 family protein n=1 Tax=Geobacter sp. DSM 9736 TaxID=1277350 RepID=UPI000B50DF0F|nr:hypothetical protein [Geobacter sp. DSM 9736]SNB48011.1 hypothetical protein SAMN06269301_3505 [Geobacter sp. DSM 9736]